MQHYEPASFQMFHYQYRYDTPAFKINALRLVSNESWAAKTPLAAI